MIVVTAVTFVILIISNLIWYVRYKENNDDWLRVFFKQERELSAMRCELTIERIKNGKIMGCKVMPKGADDEHTV